MVILIPYIYIYIYKHISHISKFATIVPFQFKSLLSNIFDLLLLINYIHYKLISSS